jgi:PAS domain-containing protein
MTIAYYYQAGLLLSALISAALAVAALRQPRSSAALWLGMASLAVAWWTIALCIEFSVTTIPTKVFWAKMEYPGLLSLMAFLVLFALEFGGARRRFTSPY